VLNVTAKRDAYILLLESANFTLAVEEPGFVGYKKPIYGNYIVTIGLEVSGDTLIIDQWLEED
jgi:hypothetical protein